MSNNDYDLVREFARLNGLVERIALAMEKPKSFLVRTMDTVLSLVGILGIVLIIDTIIAWFK